MDRENPLPLWLRHTLIGAGLFLAGAILAFGYSYRPLHGALSWEAEQLQTRLDERNRENLALRDELARQTAIETERIDPETLSQIESELDKTKRVLRQAEKDLKRADRKRKDANASAATWRKRYEELRDETTAQLAVQPKAEPGESLGGPELEIAPAAPSPSDAGAGMLSPRDASQVAPR